MTVNWGYYDKFENVMEKYLPVRGEGETKATQIVTAVNKLVYKWYNDGDVFDNTHYLKSWYNDLSSYANWLEEHCKEKATVLYKINYCYDSNDYEDLLKELADNLLNEDYLKEQNNFEKVGTIYKCEGKFKFVEYEEDDWY